MADSLDLDSVLNGEIPLKDSPTRLERPGYKRDGLYGPTPFQPKAEPIIVALTIEQHCKWCGHSWMLFGGLFREFAGTALTSDATYRNALKDAPKDEISKVQHLHEDVPYCPHCLGTGDTAGRDARQDEGGGVELPKPLSTYEDIEGRN